MSAFKVLRNEQDSSFDLLSASGNAIVTSGRTIEHNPVNKLPNRHYWPANGRCGNSRYVEYRTDRLIGKHDNLPSGL
jgi:hypothetical protein